LTCAAEEPLLDGVNPVPDSYFTATSVFLDTGYPAYYARLDGTAGWCASDAERSTTPPAMFLQVG